MFLTNLDKSPVMLFCPANQWYLMVVQYLWRVNVKALPQSAPETDLKNAILGL